MTDRPTSARRRGGLLGWFAAYPKSTAALFLLVLLALFAGLFDRASERGLQSRMITNGQRLAKRSFFEQCVEAGLKHIHVSIQSHLPEVHDFITRNPA